MSKQEFGLPFSGKVKQKLQKGSFLRQQESRSFASRPLICYVVLTSKK
jgi:hypothetical protein